MRTKARPAVVAIATLALAWPVVAGAEARARWSKPERILPASSDAVGVQIEVGRRGYAVVAWVSGEDSICPGTGCLPGSDRGGKKRRVMVAVRKRGARRFGRPRALSPGRIEGMDLGMGENGDTVLTWVLKSGARQATFRDPGSGWSEPRTFAPSMPGGWSDLSVGTDGSAIYAQDVDNDGTGNQGIVATRRPPGGEFGPLLQVPGEVRAGYGLAAAAGRGGRGVVVWAGGSCDASGAPRRYPVQAAFLGPAGLYGPSREVVGSECPTFRMSAGIDDAGGAVLLVSPGPFSSRMQAAYSPPGGPFGPAAKFRRGYGNPELGVSGAGRAVGVWEGRRGITSLVRPPGGEFGHRVMFAGPDRSGLLHAEAIAMNRDGDAVVTWQSPKSYRFKAAYAGAGGRLGSPEMATPRLPRGVSQADVAVRPNGKALIAWIKYGLGRPQGGVFVAKRRK